MDAKLNVHTVYIYISVIKREAKNEADTFIPEVKIAFCIFLTFIVIITNRSA